MKKILLLANCILLLILIRMQPVHAQTKADLGIFLGGSYYLGDINPAKQFYSTNFAIGGLYRHNFNHRFALRAGVILGALQGDDEDFADKYFYQEMRDRRFHTVLMDATVQLEFNFLDYETTSEDNYFTPYVSLGAAFTAVPNAVYPYQPSVPFGTGIKYNINYRLSIGAEWSFRKTFTDLIDSVTGLEDIPLNQQLQDGLYQYKQKGYFHENDWYSLCGIFVTYKFFTHEILCPVYDGF